MGTVVLALIPSAATAQRGEGKNRPKVRCAGKLASVVGTAKDDVIRLRGKRTIVAGLGGDDTIIGSRGADLICAGDGRDRLLGGAGDDVLYGGRQADSASGGGGDDRILSGGAKDRGVGGKGKDTLVGARGNDVLDGGDGVDLLRGQVGRDRLRGGAGADRIEGASDTDRIEAGTGADVIDGGSGRDVIDSGPDDDYVDTGYGGDTVNAGAGNDLVLGGGGGEVAYGGAGVDRLYGGLVDDTLHGGPGPDTIVGGQGVDLMFGNDGDDWMRGDINVDIYWGGSGHDTASFATATPPGPVPALDGVTVNLGDERALENPQQQILDEPDHSEEVHETESVVGSNYDDLIAGGPGGTVNGLGGSDWCPGFVNPACDLPGAPTPNVTMVNVAADPGLLVTGRPGVQADSLRVSATTSTYVVSSNHLLSSGAGCANSAPSVVSCPKPRTPLGYVTVSGGAGPDVLTMTAGYPDTATILLDGGEGDDTINGSISDDILVGGTSGRDVMKGASGDDALFSGPGADVLEGGAGHDQLVTTDACSGHLYSGGSGGGDIAGFAQNTEYGIEAQAGGTAVGRGVSPCTPTRIQKDLEVLEGTQHGDVLIGTPGDDAFIIGKQGNDVLLGLGGDDVLRGERGADAFYGGPGKDTLEAFDGIRDIALYCGPGGDKALRDRFDPPGAGCLDRDPTLGPRAKAKRNARQGHRARRGATEP